MKLLVISHNPISTYHNMGKTMLSMFCEFERGELCQLYIYPSLPDTERCGSYYRITDKDVLRSYYKLRMGGGEIRPDLVSHALFEDERDEHLYRSTKNHQPHRELLRDMMWKFSHWFGKRMKAWLRREAPDAIFVLPGRSMFLYDMALKISRYLDIPIITYICDDYYFVKKPHGLLSSFVQRLLSGKIEKLMKHTSHIVTICDELTEIYGKKFGVPTTTVMTGSNYPIKKEVHVSDKPNTITYMGNIRCNRYISLTQIGRELDRINDRLGTDYSLEIYSGEKDRDILCHFDGIRSVKLMGFVGGDDFERVFRACQILLHTEGFDDESIDSVKHSVSTKIADSLGSGIPLLAYGPEAVSSMKHLIRNDCAICVTDTDILSDKLEEVFSDTDKLITVAERGLEVARACHDRHTAGAAIKKIIENVK